MNFLPLSWTSDYDNKTYYSVIYNPCGYIHIELVSDTINSTNEALFQAYDRPRVFFNDRSQYSSGDGSDSQGPFVLSRATARMDDIKKFYSKDLNFSTIYNKEYDDGSEVIVVAFAEPT